MEVNRDIEQVEKWNKKRRALELRLGKASYRSIAAELGISVQTAHQWVRELTAIELPQEEMEELRAHEANSYDESEQRLLTCLHLMAERVREVIAADMHPGAELARMESLERTLMDVRKQRALLLGMNKPTLVKHNVTVRNVFDEEIEALVAELAGGGNIMSPPDMVDVADE